MGAAQAEGTPHSHSASELKRLLELDRGAAPYVVFRDGESLQREIVLDPDRGLVVGRGAECDVPLRWDTGASRVHAELICRRGAWFVLDDGISKNGTFVNGERVHGRRRLHDGDVMTFGSTPVLFRWPELDPDTGTLAGTSEVTVARISPSQRKVLVALCRPFTTGSGPSIPATNRQIAQELFLSDEAVKSHMRALFHRFGIEDLPQNAKRVRLAQLALRYGAVVPRDLQ
jgi:FHA domain/Bacterial regulatory proteins, luxR family